VIPDKAVPSAIEMINQMDEAFEQEGAKITGGRVRAAGFKFTRETNREP